MARGVPVNLFGVGVAESGKSLNVTAASRTNVYYDIQPSPGDKSQIAAFGMPGLDYAFTMPSNTYPVKALHSMDVGGIFAVQENKFYQLTDTSATLIGSMSVDITVPQSYSIASGGDQVVVAGAGYMYCYDRGTLTFSNVASDAAYASALTFQDGYFIAAGRLGDVNENRFWLSGLYDGTSWSALDFGSAEYSGDTLISCISKNSVLYLLGTKTYEVWQNVGDINFPFQRVTGATKELGLYALNSLCAVNDGFIALMVNRQGDIGFYKVTGYEASNITPPDLAFNIRSSDISEVGEMGAMSYSVAGHDFYQASWGDQSWAYDNLSGLWITMKSGSANRHKGLFSAMFYGYGPAFPYMPSTVYMPAPFKKTLVTSYNDGRVFVLNENSYADDGETNHREIIGNHIFMPDRGRFRILSIMLDMEQGSNDTGTTFTVRLALSRDGGHNFDEEYSDSSTTGEYTRVMQFNRLGSGRDVVPRIRMTEPCKFVLIGAVADIAPYGW